MAQAESAPIAENSEKQRGRPFQKGQSGNPGGRPKLVGHVRELAQSYTEAAMVTLVEIIENTEAPPAARVSAAQAILDRGWGKPSQPVGGADDLPPIQSAQALSEAALLAIAAGAVDG